MNIFELVNAKAIAAYWNERLFNDALSKMVGKSLFPSDKQLGLDLAWYVGSTGVPVTLRPSAFDAEARVRDRIGLDKVESEMPFFRERMMIDERERQELNKLQQAGDQYIGPILQKIYNDHAMMVAGAEVAVERMRMQLLSTGSIAVSDAGAMYEYDYAFPSGHKFTITTAGDKWSATTTANPVEDILGWQDTIENDYGVRPSRAMCSLKTFNYLVQNSAIKADIQGLQTKIIGQTDIKAYFLAKCGLEIIINTTPYKLTLTGASYKYWPDEIFTLFPAGNLGKTWYGTTPEESDLMGNAATPVQIVNTGVAVTSLQIAHPVNVQTIVSMIALPSWEQRDQCFIATVHS